MLPNFPVYQGCTRATVEVPVAWLESRLDGDVNKQFITAVIVALSKQRLPLYFYAVPVGVDFVRRKPVRGEAIFSYHSVGDAPNVFRMKEAPIRPHYSIDTAGYAGWSEIATGARYHQRVADYDLSAARSTLESFRTQFRQSRVSKYPQSDKSPDRLPDRFVFLPLQVQNDSVSSLSLFSGLELLAAAATEAKRLRVPLVVKRHPLCRSYAVESSLQMLARDNRFVTVSAANVHDLIERSRSVITVNSGVGMESLIHGKAVYCAGHSEWAAAATTLTSPDQVGRAFEHAQPRMDDFQQKLLAFLLTEYWVVPCDQKRLERRLAECLASFDPDYGEGAFGVDERHALNAEIFELHAELDHQKKITHLAIIDFEYAKRESLALRKYTRYFSAIKKALSGAAVLIGKLLRKF